MLFFKFDYFLGTYCIRVGVSHYVLIWVWGGGWFFVILWGVLAKVYFGNSYKSCVTYIPSVNFSGL